MQHAKIVEEQDKYGSPLLLWIQHLAQSSRREMLHDFASQGIELTPEQFSLLMELWKREGVSPSRLADLTGRDRPGTSRLIETLKKRGLVDREYDQDDRRRCTIILTDQGRQIHDMLLPVYGRVIDKALDGIDPSEQRQLLDLLKRVDANLKND